ncbi:MAG TPA: hypothetical protein VFR58_11625 [Flavisolibacter sp.]|nr:hypothetical protein [Flavisolibacter sp.]
MTKKTVIAVFCYKRAAKLKASMEALLANPETASMEVIFFCDGPKNEKDAPGVMATRAYIDGLQGFKEIHKQFRERNMSTGPNFFAGISHLCANYDRFIVIEDDLVVTPNYIRYMLDALDHYEGDRDVFCITGFCFPLKKNNYPYDTVIHHRFCSYGWASWSDRVSQVTWDKAKLDELHRSPGFRQRLNKEGRDLYRMLKKQLDGRISTWDIQMQVHVAENGLKVVYPVLSKASNIGFDEESTNTFGVDYLKTVTDTGEQRSFRFCNAASTEPSLRRQLQKPYGLKALATRKIINTVIKMNGNLKKAMSAWL